MDSRDDLYIIKGNNPLTLYHFQRTGLYVYASTEQILKKGLKKGMPRMEQPFEVMIREGDILRIDRQGQYSVERFDTRNLWDGTAHFSWPYWDVYAGQDEYINDLKSVASAYVRLHTPRHRRVPRLRPVPGGDRGDHVLRGGIKAG